MGFCDFVSIIAYLTTCISLLEKIMLQLLYYACLVGTNVGCIGWTMNLHLQIYLIWLLAMHTLWVISITVGNQMTDFTVSLQNWL